jgi:3'(2'), 5'-bisphosphate nucleotidase
MPSNNMLELAAIAVKAGAAIMEIYKAGTTATLKADNSPVTEADVKAEEIILAGLSQIDPQTPVIAEEAVAGGQVPRAHKRFYLVDPLDGTREFISRNGEFTVNIALIEDRAPICGVVYAPAIARLFVGEAGKGAFEAAVEIRQDLSVAKWQAFSTPPLPDNDLIAVASRSHRDRETENWLKEKGVDNIVAAGSSLKFCLVAKGEAHLYPRFGRTMEWDTAAGHGIVVAAGGQVVTGDGTPLLYGKEERGFDNPAFFVQAP